MSDRTISLHRLCAVVQHDLIDLERTDDRQLGDAARFLGTLCDASVKLGLPVQLSDRAIQSAIRNIQLRGATRAHSAELHATLSALAEQLGVTVADGGYPKVPMVPHTATIAEPVPA